MCRSSGTGGTPPGASDVWQTQGLEAPVFGSVAIFGLRGEFSDVWQMNELGDREWGVGVRPGKESRVRRGWSLANTGQNSMGESTG